ncbi:MAG: S4 domain-containing protein [Nitrospinae bacterium]|nr:S4 domain-containing protein [Nitrospinota bacterium]
MRLDQFLRYSRLIKRRPLAKSLADGGAVDIEGKTAKASSQVEIGDVLRIRLESKTLRIRVTGEARRNLSKKDAAELFEILEESAHVLDEKEEQPDAPLDFLKRS